MKTILLSLISSFFFIGCTTKEEIIYKYKYVCYEQTKLQKLEVVKIRIHKDDKDVATSYKNAIEEYFRFYENQVDRNNLNCENIKKEDKI
ncbi:hypothetical protein [Aliarcobacter lanthieri]|uniref:hypothetical protein n=1 Tax=Aliarcobacter lanthieri TaxID=1355374 RepID=UPI003AAB85AD